MKNYIVIIGLFLIKQFAWCTSTNILELVQQKKISVQAISKGGFQGEALTVILKNLTYQTVDGEMTSGNVFQSEDANAQNLIVLNTVSFMLKPSETKEILAYTNCIEPSDYAPYNGSKFILVNNTDTRLIGLAKLCSNHSLREIMQGYTWSVVRRQKTYTYTKQDSIEYWPIFKYLSTIASVEKFKEPVPPKPKFLYSTRINITENIESTSNYSLVCKNGNGEILREYYKGKTIPRGMYSVTVGYNDMVEDTTMKLSFQFLNQNEDVLAEKKVKNFTMEEKTKIYLLKTIIEYEILSPITKATLELYDPTNKLIEVLYKAKNLPSGIRKTPYSFYHTFGKNSLFKLKLFDEKRNLIQTIELNGRTSEEQK